MAVSFLEIGSFGFGARTQHDRLVGKADELFPQSAANIHSTVVQNHTPYDKITNIHSPICLVLSPLYPKTQVEKIKLEMFMSVFMQLS